jgi:hypothetical protein
MGEVVELPDRPNAPDMVAVVETWASNGTTADASRDLIRIIGWLLLRRAGLRCPAQDCPTMAGADLIFVPDPDR